MRCSDCNGSGIYIGLGFYPAKDCTSCKGTGVVDSDESADSGPAQIVNDANNDLVVDFGINEWRNKDSCLYSIVRFKFDELIPQSIRNTRINLSDKPFIFLRRQFDYNRGYIGWSNANTRNHNINFVKARAYLYIAVYEKVTHDSVYQLIWDGRK